jgi:hypothetical protein
MSIMLQLLKHHRVGRERIIAIYTKPSCTGAEFNSLNILIPIIFHSENSVLNGFSNKSLSNHIIPAQLQ